MYVDRILKGRYPLSCSVSLYYGIRTRPARALGLRSWKGQPRALTCLSNPCGSRLKRVRGGVQESKERANGLIVTQDVMTVSHIKEIVKLAADHRIPAIYTESEWAEAGGLMSYGPSFFDLERRAAVYVHKILKGAKPADLPVEQPSKFDLVINLKTVKQIGLTIPPSVLARADRVIR